MASTDSVQFLSIQQLQPNPFQPRGLINKDELSELVSSIKTYGILEPIVVAQTPAGYQIIAGERRWRAAKEAGLTEVPVMIKKTTPKGMLEMALVENVQRIDLSPMERAQAFQQLTREFGHTAADLSERIGKSPSYISNTLKLLALPDAIKDGLVGGLISEGHARAISGIEDERMMVECYKVILKENASVRRAEELSRRFKEAATLARFKMTGENGEELAVKAAPGRPSALDDVKLAEWRSQFKKLFHTKSDFKVVRSNRQTRVTITLLGSPQETQADLEKLLTIPNVVEPQEN